MVGGLGTFVGLGLLAGCISVGVSFVTLLMSVAFVGLSASGLLEFVDRRWSRRTAVASLVGLVSLAVVRVVNVDMPSATVEPGGGSSRWLNRVIPESDGVELMAWLMTTLGVQGISDREYEGFQAAADREYSRMEMAVGSIPSPLVSTLLRLQSPDAFDLIVIEPRGVGAGDDAVVFLHGAAGNWALLCWLVADGLPADVTVYCPSTDGSGNWSGDDNRRIVEATVGRAHADGAQNLTLVGLSAGAASLNAVLDGFEPGIFSEAVYLFGGSSSPPVHEIPSLFVLGTEDERFPLGALVGVVDERRRGGAAVAVRTVEADHFGLLKEHAKVAEAVLSWFSARRSRGRAGD